MTLNFEVIDDIEDLIRDIENEYRLNQGIILTESDLASLIYSRLRTLFLLRPDTVNRRPTLLNPYTANRRTPPRRLHMKNRSGLLWHMRTQDRNIKASPLHLEVPWYDSNGKLTIRPDITILEPSQLSILHRYSDGLRLPSKQFEFGGNAIIMELKFIRQKSGITIPALETIKKDFEKIRVNLIGQGINTNGRGSLYCFFVVFNKTDNRCPEFDRYLAEHSGDGWYKYLYGSGQVTFNR